MDLNSWHCKNLLCDWETWETSWRFVDSSSRCSERAWRQSTANEKISIDQESWLRSNPRLGEINEGILHLWATQIQFTCLLSAILSYFRLAQFGTEINLWDLGWKQWTGIMCTLRELPWRLGHCLLAKYYKCVYRARTCFSMIIFKLKNSVCSNYHLLPVSWLMIKWGVVPSAQDWTLCC